MELELANIGEYPPGKMPGSKAGETPTATSLNRYEEERELSPNPADSQPDTVWTLDFGLWTLDFGLYNTPCSIN
jgi:hypothetical protein